MDGWYAFIKEEFVKNVVQNKLFDFVFIFSYLIKIETQF